MPLLKETRSHFIKGIFFPDKEDEFRILVVNSARYTFTRNELDSTRGQKGRYAITFQYLSRLLAYSAIDNALVLAFTSLARLNLWNCPWQGLAYVPRNLTPSVKKLLFLVFAEHLAYYRQAFRIIQISFLNRYIMLRYIDGFLQRDYMMNNVHLKTKIFFLVTGIVVLPTEA